MSRTMFVRLLVTIGYTVLSSSYTHYHGPMPVIGASRVRQRTPPWVETYRDLSFSTVSDVPFERLIPKLMRSALPP